MMRIVFFFSSRRRHTRYWRDWSSDVCSSDLTNVEADHLDHWGSEAAYRAGFEDFVRTLDPEGVLVCCTDDAGAAALADFAAASGRPGRVVRVGEQDGADLRAVGVVLSGATSSFEVHDEGVVLGRVTLQIPGRHYVLDALAALALGLRLGFPFDDLRAGGEGFTGTRRRMERKGEAAGVTEIGRASCRERGEISVVAVSLKKKKWPNACCSII